MLRREFPEAPIVGVGAVIVRGDEVVLVRRGQEPLKGEWSLPGGVLELGETLEEGIVREVREETGLEIETVSVVEVFDRIHRDEERVRYHYVLVDYLCTVKSGDLLGASDADEARWVRREELNGHSIYRVSPFTVMVIEKAFAMSEGRCK